ncbi:MAG: PD-(D/E)XK nuclease family protein [Gemmatimonadota bacterium]|nr:PD-(D/E)XK nuclease family protein [Gemmatimonadota bacterium]MDH3421644.1 PD-(D/E)XK nuclease family protein [Gemmatimonadota bacterium]
MTGERFGESPRLVESLARVAAKHPLDRKLIVSTTLASGRELLRRLSLVSHGWIGFEVTTPRPLALQLARPGMDRLGLSALDAFEAQALLDEAMDAAMPRPGSDLRALVDGVGFRERVHEALEALRLAGVGPAALDKARLADWEKRRFLSRVLQRFEDLLRERRKLDVAGLIGMGLETLELEGGRLPDVLDADVLLLVPGLGTRGLAGRLVSGLAARGAKVLETDAVVGLDTPEPILWKPTRKHRSRSYLYAPGGLPEGLETPETYFFRAASVHDELREVLRRISERGLCFDQVEIVAPDPETYGAALHLLSVRLGVPVTYAVGLPLARTRTGRVVRSYLEWIEEGFQAHVIRRLLEAGDLRPPWSKRHHAAAALARRFRSLRVGWGRKRYRSQIRQALAGVDRQLPGRHDDEAHFHRRQAHARSELEALRSILFPALKATPTVPDQLGEDGRRVSPAELARGLRAFLRRVPKGTGPDANARDDVEHILERIEATLLRRTDFRAAVTVLRRHLSIRVRAGSLESADEVSAWSAEGGHIHLSDLEHGGFVGREATFIVGLDADRVPGFEGQDPVLLDSDRRVLGAGLPTSSELMRERMFRFGALYSRLRGSVTLSYGAWDATEARSLAPSSVLLQALRSARGDPALTFEDLDATLGRIVCAVPAEGRSALDGDDTWMAELGRGGVMRAGVDEVGAAYPRLSAGLPARRALREGTPGPGHGVIQPRPDVLDPRRNPSQVVSASRLEALGACPLRYLHSMVLGLRPPDDPELDPDRWLDALRRGSLLHRVYERTLRGARDRGLSAEEVAFESLALDVLAESVARTRDEIPIPGEGTMRREFAALENDVRAFVRMVRQLGAPWVALELKFGLGEDEPVPVAVRGGELRLRGAVDRVDEDLVGVHVIDYKTGVARDFAGTGAFFGGRRLQHALYALVAEDRLGGKVATGQYHFPTVRGEHRTLAFNRLERAGVGDLLGLMLDGVASGSFVPTDRADDCRFCDFAQVCRVRELSFGKLDSPMAAWSQEHLNVGVWPAFANLKRTRTFED